MDAQTFGAFIARCRKDKQMTQAELAEKLHVTDKAVSRWERGIGFPDINTLEPLAEALEISLVELMKSKRLANGEVTRTEAAGAISDTLQMVDWQRRQERRWVWIMLGLTAVFWVIVWLFDKLKWRWEAILFEGIGVWLPLFCLSGALALLLSGLWRKKTAKAYSQTLLAVFYLLIPFIVLASVFFLAGALGIGPIPS